MNTEITDTRSEAGRRWILYDGNCPLCSRAAQRFAPVLRRYHFSFAPLQNPPAHLPHTFGGDEMALVTEDGACHGGAEAIVQIARRIWWARPFFALARIPGVHPLLVKGYRAVAARRTCLIGACKLRANRMSDWLPLIVLPIAALAVHDRMPAWALMWSLAFALAAKWLMRNVPHEWHTRGRMMLEEA